MFEPTALVDFDHILMTGCLCARYLLLNFQTGEHSEATGCYELATGGESGPGELRWPGKPTVLFGFDSIMKIP
jgi:hypothetical protein